MSTDPTCAERIASHLEGRAASIGELYGQLDDDTSPNWDDEREEAQEALWELPLSVETVRTVKVLLSTGGPADGLTIELDTDGNVASVRYWFADWFDHAETVVTDENSALYRYAVEVAELEWERGL